ncbi:MAG: M3 family oligoendopeptidase [Clostridia bacterium]|nr:M3 family oligoendopeptidase [Clostridia bacterium]
MNWDLSKLYSGFNDEKLHADASAALEKLAALRAAISELPGDKPAENLAKVIEQLSEAANLQIKVASFTFLTLAVEANNDEARAFYGRVIEMNIESTQVNSALSRYLGSVEDLDALIAGNAVLEAHAFMLKEMKTSAAHVIDPALEPTVLKMQMTGGTAWEQLRDQLDANLMIPFEKDGKTESLPLSAIRGLAYSADADVRRRAYEAEIAAYPRIEIPMAACLNGIKGEALTLIGLKNYETVLDTALDASRMDRATLDALLAAMHESLPMFRRYFRLKAKLLGYEGGLKFYDLFAPVGENVKQYSLEEARATLVDVMGRFSPKMASFIDNAFEQRWIDVYPREGKGGGAFCSGVHPLKMSYVMTNFDGSFSSVGTLAHELGHAYHNLCTNDAPVLMSDYPMPLAETASIFNETLLMEKALASADDKAKITLLEQQLGDAAQVVVDILSRYLFETEVVERRKDHSMSAREMCEIMLDAQKQTYGDGLDPDCLHPYMWACKSHYYSTGIHFYNFPYAFGMLFGYGVFAQYQEKGDAFVEEYDRLLAATGSGSVRDVAASVGIDVTDKAFWMKSVKTLEAKVDLLEKLIG